MNEYIVKLSESGTPYHVSGLSTTTTPISESGFLSIFHPPHQDLENRINELQQELNILSKLIEESPIRVRIVEARDVTDSEAEELILEYLETHEVAYPDDIADEFGLDLEVTMKAVERLRELNTITDGSE